MDGKTTIFGLILLGVLAYAGGAFKPQPGPAPSPTPAPAPVPPTVVVPADVQAAVDAAFSASPTAAIDRNVLAGIHGGLKSSLQNDSLRGKKIKTTEQVHGALALAGEFGKPWAVKDRYPAIQLLAAQKLATALGPATPGTAKTEAVPLDDAKRAAAIVVFEQLEAAFLGKQE